MNEDLFDQVEQYIQESLEEFDNRYSGFGGQLYSKLSYDLPPVFRNLVFYKKKTGQTGNSYAEFVDFRSPFAIQLDPIGEVIVLWNKEKHIEIGFWSNDPYKDALEVIRKELIEN